MKQHNALPGVVMAGALALMALPGLLLAQDEPTRPRSPVPTRPGIPGHTPIQTDPGFPTTQPMSLADRISKAHNERAWRAHNAFTCDITVTMGGATMLDGSLLYDTNRHRIRFDLKDGTKLIWDGDHAWVSPASTPFESAHFHLHTWPHLLALPFRLNERGTVHEEQPATSFEGRVCNTLKLTFDERSGRVTPKDWFLVYSDLVTHAMYGAAYTTTHGRSVEEAEREPRFVLYEDPAIVNGVVIHRKWTISNWQREQGPTGNAVGEVHLKNLHFTQLREEAFAKPDDAREDKMPGTDEAEQGDEEGASVRNVGL